MAAIAGLPRLSAYADRVASWSVVGIGFSLPISTALDNVLVAVLLLSWIASGQFREKLALIRQSAVALFALGLFLLYLAGASYSIGDERDVLRALDKAAVLLLIPLLISLAPDAPTRERALHAFLAALLLTLLLSYLVWLGLVPETDLLKGNSSDPSVFKKHITQSVFMAFGAFLLAVHAEAAPGTRAKVLLWILAGLAAFNVMFVVHGRTGQLVLLALAGYYVVRRQPMRGMALALAAGAVVACVVYLAPSSAIHQRIRTTIAEVEHWQSGKPAHPQNMRLEAWSNSVQILREHPLLGVGTGGFFTAYADKIRATPMLQVDQPENQYLLTAVQLGLVGLAAFIAMLVGQWVMAANLGGRMRIDLVRGVVVAMAVGCLFNSFLLDHAEALFYAWVIGLLFGCGNEAGALHPAPTNRNVVTSSQR